AWRPLELNWDANFQPKPHGDVAGEPLGWKMARMDIPHKIAHVFVIATAMPTASPLPARRYRGPIVALLVPRPRRQVPRLVTQNYLKGTRLTFRGYGSTCQRLIRMGVQSQMTGQGGLGEPAMLPIEREYVSSKKSENTMQRLALTFLAIGYCQRLLWPSRSRASRRIVPEGTNSPVRFVRTALLEMSSCRNRLAKFRVGSARLRNVRVAQCGARKSQ